MYSQLIKYYFFNFINLFITYDCHSLTRVRDSLSTPTSPRAPESSSSETPFQVPRRDGANVGGGGGVRDEGVLTSFLGVDSLFSP